MSLLYLFPVWIVAEQKGNEVRRVRYHWPSGRTKAPPETFFSI